MALDDILGGIQDVFGIGNQVLGGIASIQSLENNIAFRQDPRFAAFLNQQAQQLAQQQAGQGQLGGFNNLFAQQATDILSNNPANAALSNLGNLRGLQAPGLASADALLSGQAGGGLAPQQTVGQGIGGIGTSGPVNLENFGQPAIQPGTRFDQQTNPFGFNFAEPAPEGSQFGEGLLGFLQDLRNLGSGDDDDDDDDSTVVDDVTDETDMVIDRSTGELVEATGGVEEFISGGFEGQNPIFQNIIDNVFNQTNDAGPRPDPGVRVVPEDRPETIREGDSGSVSPRAGVDTQGRVVNAQQQAATGTPPQNRSLPQRVGSTTTAAEVIARAQADPDPNRFNQTQQGLEDTRGEGPGAAAARQQIAAQNEIFRGGPNVISPEGQAAIDARSMSTADQIAATNAQIAANAAQARIAATPQSGIGDAISTTTPNFSVAIDPPKVPGIPDSGIIAPLTNPNIVPPTVSPNPTVGSEFHPDFVPPVNPRVGFDEVRNPVDGVTPEPRLDPARPDTSRGGIPITPGNLPQRDPGEVAARDAQNAGLPGRFAGSGGSTGGGGVGMGSNFTGNPNPIPRPDGLIPPDRSGVSGTIPRDFFGQPLGTGDGGLPPGFGQPTPDGGPTELKPVSINNITGTVQQPGTGPGAGPIPDPGGQPQGGAGQPNFLTQSLQGLQGLAQSGGPITQDVQNRLRAENRDTQDVRAQNAIRALQERQGATGFTNSGLADFGALQARLGAAQNITRGENQIAFEAANTNFGANLAANQALSQGALGAGQFGLDFNALQNQIFQQNRGFGRQLALDEFGVGLAGQNQQIGILDQLGNNIFRDAQFQRQGELDFRDLIFGQFGQPGIPQTSPGTTVNIG